MYRREVDVYDALKDLQGHHIPHLLVTLTVPVSPSTSFQKSKRDKTEDTVKYIDSPAIPLQYVNGYNLQKITDHCPRPTWRPICEDAIRTIQLITDRQVLHIDVRKQNYIICKDTWKVFLIDFALCKLRCEYGYEEDWREGMAFADSEGMVGRDTRWNLKEGLCVAGLRCLRSWMRILLGSRYRIWKWAKD